MEKKLKVDKVQILDVPDEVYIHLNGLCYYPKPTKDARTAIPYEEAVKQGFKPSKAYMRFLETLSKQQETEVEDGDE